MPCKISTLMLMTLLFVTLLAGCGAKEPHVLVATPPAVLLHECAAPPMPAALMHPASVREYATAATRWALDMEEALSACNADKKAIREWCEDMERDNIGNTLSGNGKRGIHGRD